MSPTEADLKELSDVELIYIARECGLLPLHAIQVGDEVAIPGWLAQTLIERGIVEAVVPEASA